jgi:hypothetical protein
MCVRERAVIPLSCQVPNRKRGGTERALSSDDERKSGRERERETLCMCVRESDVALVSHQVPNRDTGGGERALSLDDLKQAWADLRRRTTRQADTRSGATPSPPAATSDG